MVAFWVAFLVALLAQGIFIGVVISIYVVDAGRRPDRRTKDLKRGDMVLWDDSPCTVLNVLYASDVGTDMRTVCFLGDGARPYTCKAYADTLWRMI